MPLFLCNNSCKKPFGGIAGGNKAFRVHNAASSYDDTVGVPTLFHKSMFPGLLQLKGDVGARAIIQQHTGNVELVAFARGSMY